MAAEFDNDTLDSRIDKRLALLQDGLELRLTKVADARFKDRFDSTVKLFGWAFGLIALVFTLLGIKTAIDLREVAERSAIKEVREKLAIDDPNSVVRRDVNRIVARGIINTYLLETARHKGNLFAEDVRLTDVEVQRLIDVITDSNSEIGDFRDAVDVLVRSNRSKENSSLDRLLLQLGKASDDQFKWMLQRSDKRAALFAVYREAGLIGSAREVASNEKTEKDLVVAASRYLARQRDHEAAPIFERLATRDDKDISRSALEALATVSPESKAVSSALAINADSSTESVADAIRLAAIVARPAGNFFENDPKAELRTSLASVAVDAAINRGAVFRVADFASGKPQAALSTRDSMGSLHGVPSSILVVQGTRIFSRLIRTASDPGQAKKVLRALCLERDDQCQGVVQATLNGNAKIGLSNGLMLDAAMAPAGVFLRPRSPSPTADILVSWTDPDAIRQTLVLDHFIKPKNISFAVRSVRALADEDGEDE